VLAGLGNRAFAFALSLIAHFRSFQNSDCAITLFVAFFKRALVRLLFLSLFSKDR